MWSVEFEKKVYGTTSRTIEILTELGEIDTTFIENIKEEINILEKLGYECYFDINKNKIQLLKENKYYVIRKKNDIKEQVFEGTLYDALYMQQLNGVSETDTEILITIENIVDFEELFNKNYFGDGLDGYIYFLVSKEEYCE